MQYVQLFARLRRKADLIRTGLIRSTLVTLNFLRVNCLWFQPIHPVGTGAHGDCQTGAAYQPLAALTQPAIISCHPQDGHFFEMANGMD